MKSLPLLLLLVIASFALLLQVNKPFYGYHDWNGITYGQISKNFVRYGLLTTKIGQVENISYTTPDHFRYDTHYLPLLTLSISVFIALFGSHEWVIRLFPIIISLGSLYLIYQLTLELTNNRTAYLATIFALVTPVFLYFGKNPVHEPLALFFILLNTYLFLNFQRSPTTQNHLRLFLSSFISLFAGWPTFYLQFILGLLGLTKRYRPLLKHFFLPFLVLIFHLIHIRILTGSFSGGELIQIIMYRLNLSPQTTGDHFTLWQFLLRFFLWSRNMFTPLLLSFSIIGLMFVRKHRLYLLLLFSGWFHPLIFSNAGYIHDYLQLPALGFVAVSSALLFSQLFKKPSTFLSIGILASILIFWSKYPFTKAMIYSHMSQPAYNYALQIKKELPVNRTQFITSAERSYLKDVVVPYYLEKEVIIQEEESNTYLLTHLSDHYLVQPQP